MPLRETSIETMQPEKHQDNIDEAIRIEGLKDELGGHDPQTAPTINTCEAQDGTRPPAKESIQLGSKSDESQPSTNPLFPPLPMYGPPTPMRRLQSLFFRATSAVLSFCFLLAIVAGATLKSVPKIWRRIRYYILLQDPHSTRPFYQEEQRRATARQAAERTWAKEKRHQGTRTPSGESTLQNDEYVPTEGGPDPLVPNLAYYARREGLNAETLDVQTEDGFIIELHHIYDPRERRAAAPPSQNDSATISELSRKASISSSSYAEKDSHQNKKKYPILLLPGLLQSSGSYCSTSSSSLAFYLSKSGFDVYLGDNRCGFRPRHTTLDASDPRMWAWNIRHMSVFDLPALIERVLAETGFEKLGLVAHSQGTAEVFLALAKEQVPEIGEKVSVFCALAPAVYAGPLVGRLWFRFMHALPPSLFSLTFGIHSFIPLMPVAHSILPARLYSFMGYFVFSFLFGWSDEKWDRGCRDRCFQFAPVHVSAESMRWWLGREGFAKQKCVLATREEGQLEDEEDEEQLTHQRVDSTTTEKSPWFTHQFPPLALWIAGSDNLVDGRRLLRRFDRGREPHVRVVHKKIIEEYEHLDVIWAMDVIEQVGREVREVLWRSVGEADRLRCRVPKGCEPEIEVHNEE